MLWEQRVASLSGREIWELEKLIKPFSLSCWQSMGEQTLTRVSDSSIWAPSSSLCCHVDLRGPDTCCQCRNWSGKNTASEVDRGSHPSLPLLSSRVLGKSRPLSGHPHLEYRGSYTILSSGALSFCLKSGQNYFSCTVEDYYFHVPILLGEGEPHNYTLFQVSMWFRERPPFH